MTTNSRLQRLEAAVYSQRAPNWFMDNQCLTGATVEDIAAILDTKVCTKKKEEILSGYGCPYPYAIDFDRTAGLAGSHNGLLFLQPKQEYENMLLEGATVQILTFGEYTVYF